VSIPVTIFIPKGARKWTSRDLNAKLASHGFPIQLHDFDPQRQTGFVPASFDGQQTGFEYFIEPIEAYLDSIEERRQFEADDPYSEEDLLRVRASRDVVQLVTHASSRGRAAAVVVASCIAELTDGWVLDEPVWRWHSSKNAVSWARDKAAAMKPQFESDETPTASRKGLKKFWRAMGFERAAFSVLWLLAGSIGTFLFFTQARYAESAMSFVLVILAVGLWLGWRWKG